MIRATLVTFKKDGTGEDRRIGDVILPHAPRPGEWIWLPWMPTADGYSWRVVEVSYFAAKTAQIAEAGGMSLYIEVEPLRDEDVPRAPWADVVEALSKLGWSTDDVQAEFSRQFDEALLARPAAPVGGPFIHGEDTGEDEPSGEE